MQAALYKLRLRPTQACHTEAPRVIVCARDLETALSHHLCAQRALVQAFPTQQRQLQAASSR